ncbi:probable G-protein coupled receptor 156 [Zootoca vivipara]|uniref:probable G-protein coupled receptor 156 n=1 Tax=Zootoca vivipara TaxID=8524 RepID=UPI00293B9E9C|nr:probable G-protein coupled receptor 156 [Zootoca vivipara]
MVNCSAQTMWLNEGLQCAVETGFNYANQCDNTQEQQQKTLQNLWTITITSSDSSCKNSAFSAAILGIAWVFLTSGVLLSFFFLIFTIHFRKNRIVKMSSPNLNIVTLLGSGLTYSSAYLFGVEKQNSLTRPSMEMLVQVRISLLCIGVSLAFGPILGKSWRLYKVFSRQVPDKRVIIKDFQLLVMVSVLVLADIILLLIWMFVDPVQCLQSLNADLKVTERGLTCTASQGYYCTSMYSDLWLLLFLGFKGILLIYGAYLAGLTDDLSCSPVNQSLTLIIGIAIIFLSTGVMLVVNRFFHLWHNLVFGFTSGGIFVCTSTINCLIFIPQVRKWKAFEKQKDDINNMAKYFTSSSKNFHSTMYSDEEIYQLLGEKNSMMQQLVEKDTAIATLQEQVNNAKKKLVRLVTAEDKYNTIDSPFPPSSYSAANCSYAAVENPMSYPFSPGQGLNSRQHPRLSHSQCKPGLLSKKDSTDDLEHTNQHRQNILAEIAAEYRLLNGCKNVAGHSSDQDQWFPQYTTTLSMGTLQDPLGQSFSTPREEAKQPCMPQRQLPGMSHVSSEKLQEILQELSMSHVAIAQVSPRAPEQSVDGNMCTLWEPEETQAGEPMRLSPCKSRQGWETPSPMAPETWRIVDKATRGRQRSFSGLTEFHQAAAGDTEDRCSLHQPPSSSSPVVKKTLNYKAENWSKHSSNEGCGWLLDKGQGKNCVSTLYLSRSRNLCRHQNFLTRAVLGPVPSQHFYPDSDSGSSSSGRVTHCHHRQQCDVCHYSLSSSSDSCITDTGPELGVALDYCAKLYGKPQPVVNFIEDLEPTYV